MKAKSAISFFTLLLLISFASVNAVLFTPALPAITDFFAISENAAQQTITWFLIGYALGQLIYGPLANRFGRKPALYGGIALQIMSSFLCVLAGVLHLYLLMVIGRFLLALGSGVGLKMTFTLINEAYEPKQASEKMSYLMLAFAITPGLGIAIGGILNAHFGWESCFYAGAIYGVILLLLVSRLPETLHELHYNALKLSYLYHAYTTQFKNFKLVVGALLMGGVTCFVYVFAALAPFISITIYGMKSSEYGLANIIPALGMLFGSLVSARLSKLFSFTMLMRTGIIIAILGVIIMFIAMKMHAAVIYAVFLPMMLVYFGSCFVLANASTLAMSSVSDKAHGAAVMSFINMGTATVVVLSVAAFQTTAMLLPMIYLVIGFMMMMLSFSWSQVS